jgi:DNA-binding transcriptional ArsR family regulator
MRRIAMVDLDDGEPVHGVPVLYRQRRKKYITEDYQLMFSAAMIKATEDKELGQQEWRVLMRLIAMLGIRDENAWKSVNLTDLGKMLDMKQPNVSAAMKTLVGKGIIIKGVKIGRGHAYSLNPNFGWKGPAAQWPEASKAAPKITAGSQVHRARRRARHLRAVPDDATNGAA